MHNKFWNLTMHYEKNHPLLQVCNQQIANLLCPLPLLGETTNSCIKVTFDDICEKSVC